MTKNQKKKREREETVRVWANNDANRLMASAWAKSWWYQRLKKRLEVAGKGIWLKTRTMSSKP